MPGATVLLLPMVLFWENIWNRIVHFRTEYLTTSYTEQLINDIYIYMYIYFSCGVLLWRPRLWHQWMLTWHTMFLQERSSGGRFNKKMKGRSAGVDIQQVCVQRCMIRRLRRKIPDFAAQRKSSTSEKTVQRLGGAPPRAFAFVGSSCLR